MTYNVFSGTINPTHFTYNLSYKFILLMTFIIFLQAEFVDVGAIIAIVVSVSCKFCPYVFSVGS